MEIEQTWKTIDERYQIPRLSVYGNISKKAIFFQTLGREKLLVIFPAVKVLEIGVREIVVDNNLVYKKIVIEVVCGGIKGGGDGGYAVITKQ